MEKISIDFTGQNVAITGGLGDIGRACAEGVIAGGGRAVILDLNPELGAKTCAELGGPEKALFWKMDQSNFDEVFAVFEAVLAKVGQLHALINNAGIVSTLPIADLTMKEWLRVMDVDLNGVFACTKAVFPHMCEKKYGHIVNISSVAAKVGGGLLGTSAYVTSKAGVIGLTKATAREGAPHGVNCVGICPGGIWTNFIKDLPQEKLDAIKNGIPLKRFCTPQECANIILLYASSLSNFCTGDIIDVDGGITRD